MSAEHFFTRREILESQDFRRVLALPRRPPRTPEEVEALTKKMTALLRRPVSPCGDAPVVKGLCTKCRAPVELRPVQAQALYEIGTTGGLFGPIRVGGGKTLLSLLAPFVLDARRPVLLLPASLITKTEQERRRLANHWRIGSNVRLMSYESLGREEQMHAIDFAAPDLIIADEVHRLKNKKAGVTKRVRRYMRHNPKTKQPWPADQRPRFVGISGTMLKGGTIKAFAHLLHWSHADGAPIPLEDGELDEWAECLDEKVSFSRPRPGPLLKFALDEDRIPGDDLRTARRAFHRRLIETPGVVSTAGEQVACSLYIRGHVYKVNTTTEENFRTLRGVKDDPRYPGWVTPDGWPLSMAAEVWRVARELALGFHGVWNPRPPIEWVVARKAWAAFVRETLSRSRTLDTEGQVQSACERGDLFDESYAAWKEVRDTFRPNPQDVWHDTSALETAEAWLKKAPGIVWVDHIFFGEELERRTGVPYFREEGCDATGRNLQTLSDLIKEGKAKPQSIIASAHACSTGFNLQPWSRNLLTSCPSGADRLEQLIGRTHRDGQEEDQVEVDVMIGCVENIESWDKAIAEARMAVDTLGDSQKILIADVTMPTADEFFGRGPRWTKTRGKIDETP